MLADRMMDERLTTIARFSHPIQAHLVKTKLESEGIECFVADEHTVQMNWLYSSAVGGVKLDVRESDVERASEVLGRMRDEISREPTGEGEIESERACPRCGSMDATYENFSRRVFFLSWLLLGFPVPFLKRRWTCKRCEHQWKAR